MGSVGRSEGGCEDVENQLGVERVGTVSPPGLCGKKIMCPCLNGGFDSVCVCKYGESQQPALLLVPGEKSDDSSELCQLNAIR